MNICQFSNTNVIVKDLENTAAATTTTKTVEEYLKSYFQARIFAKG